MLCLPRHNGEREQERKKKLAHSRDLRHVIRLALRSDEALVIGSRDYGAASM